MSEKWSKKFYVTMGLSLLIFCVFEYNKYRNIEIDIHENGKLSIGKYIKYHKGIGKNEDYEEHFFEFFVDEIKFKESIRKVPDGFEENISLFYRIKYSDKFKGEFKVFFENK